LKKVTQNPAHVLLISDKVKLAKISRREVLPPEGTAAHWVHSDFLSVNHDLNTCTGILRFVWCTRQKLFKRRARCHNKSPGQVQSS